MYIWIMLSIKHSNVWYHNRIMLASHCICQVRVFWLLEVQPNLAIWTTGRLSEKPPLLKVGIYPILEPPFLKWVADCQLPGLSAKDKIRGNRPAYTAIPRFHPRACRQFRQSEALSERSDFSIRSSMRRIPKLTYLTCPESTSQDPSCKV